MSSVLLSKLLEIGDTNNIVDIYRRSEPIDKRKFLEWLHFRYNLRLLADVVEEELIGTERNYKNG